MKNPTGNCCLEYQWLDPRAFPPFPLYPWDHPWWVVTRDLTNINIMCYLVQFLILREAYKPATPSIF